MASPHLLEESIQLFEEENAQMELVERQLKSQFELKSAEIHSYKTHLASENLVISNMDHIIEDFEKELYSLKLSIDHLDELCAFLLDVPLCGLVFRRTRAAIATGSPFTDAIVDAIREAAEIPHSPWSSLIPAVIGERTLDQYTSALRITLKARSDLRQTKTLAQYWKNTAREHGLHDDVITPSGSTLSDVQEVLSTERQKAVNALWSKLKSGELPIRSTVLSQAKEEEGTISAVDDESIEPASSVVMASSLFMTSEPKSKSDIATSAAASMATMKASLVRSSSGGSFPRSGSSSIATEPVASSRLRSDSEHSEISSSLPRLSLFSSDFRAIAKDLSSSRAGDSGSESGSGDFTTEDALQSLKLIYNRFNDMKFDSNTEMDLTSAYVAVFPETEATPVSFPPTSTVTNEDDPLSNLAESSSDFELEADFVFVSIPTSCETPPSKRRRSSVLQSLSINLSSKIPRRISISLSPISSKINSSPTRTRAKPNTQRQAEITPSKTNLKEETLSSTPEKDSVMPTSGSAATSLQSSPRQRTVSPAVKLSRNRSASSSPAGTNQREQEREHSRGNPVSPSQAHSLFRPTISSSLKQSKQSTASPSPTRTSPARIQVKSKTSNSNSGNPIPTSSPPTRNRARAMSPAARSVSPRSRSTTPMHRSNTPLPGPTRTSGVSPSLAKKSAMTQDRDQMRAATPAQLQQLQMRNQGPTSPIPTGKGKGKGKNSTRGKKNDGKENVDRNAVVEEKRIRTS